VIAQLNSPLPRLLSVSLEPTMGETFRRQLAELIRLTDGVPGVPHPAFPVIMTSLNGAVLRVPEATVSSSGFLHTMLCWLPETSPGDWS
jgi:hypothetical protein